MKKIQKMKKLFLMPLLLSMALLFVGCFGGDTDDPDPTNVDLYGTTWIGTDRHGHAFAMEFDSSQTDSKDRLTYAPQDGTVYLTISRDNTRQNYTYDYEYEDSTGTYKWMIRDSRGDKNVVIIFSITDENTFLAEYMWHADTNTVFKRVGLAITSTSFTKLEGTLWAGLNPMGRPMLYTFGKTRTQHYYDHELPNDRPTYFTDASTTADNKVMVTFAHDGSSSPYDLNPVYDSTTKTGRISTTGSDTGGIGTFTVSNDYKVIEFDNFFGFHGPGMKIYRIK